MQKFFFITTQEIIKTLQSDMRFIYARITYSNIDSERVIVMCLTPHSHLRFTLADEGYVVLPGHHDPTPIGESISRHLSHIDAQPHHSMREVSLRLYEKHGPAFHPDT
jgi:hypothetical protein